MTPTTHVCFDHDGTLSTLRSGWESVMVPMMVDSICGGIHPGAELHDAIEARVREYVSKTTGIQTLKQMHGLVDLVKEYGRTTPLEPLAYKRIYNDRLMEHMGHRVAQLQARHKTPLDFEIPGATRLLRELHRRGVEITIFSGTDDADVKREATLMEFSAYADGIYGSLNDIAYEAKAEVLKRILADKRDARVIVVGDGPVEIEEGKKAGAFTIGVCNDERGGYSHDKAARVLAAGADRLVLDFKNLPVILEIMGL